MLEVVSGCVTFKKWEVYSESVVKMVLYSDTKYPERINKFETLQLLA